MFHLAYTEGVLENLKELRATDRKRILDKIEDQLRHNPTQETRNKKIVVGLKPPWEHEEPVWELRDRRIPGLCRGSRRTGQAATPNHRKYPMKVISLEKANLGNCVREAQQDGVVLTSQGKPVALVIGVQGLDLEQIELGHSDDFWTLLRQRRKEKTMSREELEKRLAEQE